MRAKQQLPGEEINSGGRGVGTGRGTVWQLAGGRLEITSNSNWRKNVHLLGQQPRGCRMTRTERGSHRMARAPYPAAPVMTRAADTVVLCGCSGGWWGPH